MASNAIHAVVQARVQYNAKVQCLLVLCVYIARLWILGYAIETCDLRDFETGHLTLFYRGELRIKGRNLMRMRDMNNATSPAFSIKPRLLISPSRIQNHAAAKVLL